MSEQKSTPGARDSFSSKFGVIAAAAGSAVGLGNVWRFPYIAGEGGGSAFLIICIGFVLLLGIPIAVAEFSIGRHGQANAMTSFKNIAPGTKWHLTGFLGILAAFVILSYYTTISGWTLEYMVNSFSIGEASSPMNNPNYFQDFISEPFRPILLQGIFMLLTAGIVVFGVSKGIEKASKILMPLLLLLIIVMCIRAVTLEGGMEGVKFLVKPDFSKVTGQTFLNAMGQAFFSLSLGMGVMITYGSYIQKKDNLLSSAAQIALADTVIAVLSGIMVFGSAFAFGIAPSQGPSLVFVTLPNIFKDMFMGNVFAFIFFLLLTIAALTSAISIFEAIVAYIHERFKMSRIQASALGVVLVLAVGIPITLSEGELGNLKILGRNLLDFFDFLASNIMLPLGALLITLFAGWFHGHQGFRDEITNGGTANMKIYPALEVLIRFVAPVFIVIILMAGIMQI